MLSTILPPGAKLVYKEWEQMVLCDRVVYQRGPSGTDVECLQLFLPGRFRKDVFKSLYDNHGHMGVERTFKLLRDRFYWPQMRSDVEKYCKS